MADEPTDPIRVLVIDDDPGHAMVVAEGLTRVGYDCTTATSGAAGAKLIESDEFDVILTDLRMAGVDGLGIVKRAREAEPDAEVIVITGFGDVRTAVEAIKLGAAHYLLKPIDLEELRAIVGKSAERVRLTRANRDLQRQLDEKFGFEGVVGNSPRMQQVLARLKAFAPTRATVLISGENGTGKELAARALHFNSPRKNKPFVAMNCTALNENLLDDELFGHEAHAFTGADKLRKGRFEYASGGTLFLDEIGDMPVTLQAKLLRVLENGEVTRIGSNEPIKVDVRLLAATNRNLQAMIDEGTFRQDLFHRLKVGTIRMPPLRERKEDLPLLYLRFLKEMNERHHKQVTKVGEDLRKAFQAYDWPGNVRELRNVIESAVVMDTDGELRLDDVDESEPLRRRPGGDGAAGKAGADALVGRPLTEVERYYKEMALELTGGNREEAARLLGIGERTLYRDIQDWKLQDRIREALAAADGDPAEAAAKLGMKPDELERKLRKFGVRADEE